MEQKDVVSEEVSKLEDNNLAQTLGTGAMALGTAAVGWARRHPYLAAGIAAATAFGVKDKVLEYMSKATDGAVNTVQDMVDFSSKGKGQAALALSSFAHAGIHPDEYIKAMPGMTMSQDLQNLRDRLMATYQKRRTLLNQGSDITTAKSRDEHLLNIATLKAIQDAFNVRGRRSVMALHDSMRSFVEMSSDVIEETMSLMEAVG